ncbi:hypothetical protein H0H87_010288 [Tephrocybe sp. NHM501043]|nr:hypothetical protein H0H87_010288 [Tephrocybe sp. NHM501043]
MAERPSRAIKLTNKLQDSDNVAVPSIAAHHHHAPPASHTQGDPSVSVIEILDDDNMINSATSRDAEVAREVGSNKHRRTASPIREAATDTETEEDVKPLPFWKGADDFQATGGEEDLYKQVPKDQRIDGTRKLKDYLVANKARWVIQ